MQFRQQTEANEYFHIAAQCANYYSSKQIILVVVEELQKATVSSVMSPCKSIRLGQLGSHGSFS